MADMQAEGTTPEVEADADRTTPTTDERSTDADTGAQVEKPGEGQQTEPTVDTEPEKGEDDPGDGEKADSKPDEKSGDQDEADDGDDGDLDEDDDRLDAKVRRRIREKNRENRRLRDRATTAERQVLAYRVADKSGLPLSLADRLKGTTEDELAADAADMLALLGRKSRVSPTDLPDDGRKVAGQGGENVSYDDLASKMYSR